jgi:membrane protein DedA with SNARE-associated domain
MSEISLTDWLLTGMLNYGAPTFSLALLIGAIGVPLPNTFFVLAAGAFARQSAIDGPTAAMLGFLGAVVGDSLSYGIGRVARTWVQRRFVGSATWHQALVAFERRGGLAIYLTRFLITPLAIPTNLIAGSGGYTYWRFFLYTASGELTWIILYGGLGYLFGAQWEMLSRLVSDFSGLLVGLIVLGAGLYVWLRRRKPTDVTVATKRKMTIRK